MSWPRTTKSLAAALLLLVVLLALALSSVPAFRNIARVSAGGLPPRTPPVLGSDVERLKNTTVQIAGQPVTLVNGISETEAAPGSASRVVTRYFGNEATGDLNGDGLADAAFLLTQTRGGSGTFFYVVAALATPSGLTGTNAVLLGDRVAPQATHVTDRTVVVSYADRAPGTPMTTPPSVGTSKTLHLVGTTLVER